MWRRLKFLFLGLLVVATTVLVAVGAPLLLGSPIEPVDQESFHFVEKLRHLVPGGTLKIVRVELNRIFDREAELIEPLTLLVNKSTQGKYQNYLSAIESCEEDQLPKTAGDAQAAKLLSEFKIHCLKHSPENSLWKKPPFLHPQGGSWLKHLNSKYGFEIRSQDRRYLHAGEDLQLGSPEVLSGILKRDQVIWDGDSLLFHLETAGPIAFFADLAANNTLLSELNYHFVPEFGPACARIESTGCWMAAVPWWRRNQTLLLSLASGLILISLLGLISVLWMDRRRAEALRTLSALAISHELRHPVSTMSLIIDSWRDDYDQLSDRKKDQFLAFANEVRRLRFLVQATETFLRRGSGERISWQIKNIESLSAWGQNLAASYGVEFESGGPDGPFRTDPYWLGVAIENLIKNALKYGQPPVRLHFDLESNGRRLHVRVVDQGAGKPASAEPGQAEGLGLGHLLVNRISREMGGRGLSASFSPTVYVFSVKELSDG